MSFRPRFVAVCLAALLAATVSCGRFDAEKCKQCGRDECKNLAFAITLADGSSVKTCCPRCALRYIDKERPAVASLAVRDFETAGTLDARRALYVEGSDVHPCAMHEGAPPTDARGCCLKAVYDRCEPSLVAFASAEKAEAFAREHGGFVRTFEALEAAKR